jgi:C-terminal processing protease CtpA/Prc
MRLAITTAIALLAADPGFAATVTQADRAAVVGAVTSHLESEYVDPTVGRKAATQLRRRFDAAALEEVGTGAGLAETLTRALREETGDGHLKVEFSATPLSEDTAAADKEFSAQEMQRYYGAHLNFGVRKAERLEDNIGLLELSVFPPAAMGGDTVAAAMQMLAHTDALIIDLRQNGGGGDTVSLVASYLFDDRVDERKPLSGIYDRPSGVTQQQYTLPYVPGARFGGTKPVYILISKRTFSAAEAFTYDMQALERATVIGERSGGGAHPFNYRRIHPHFVLWSVTQKSLNPITGKNWQGTGVQPDVVVDPQNALERALALIEAKSKAR